MPRPNVHVDEDKLCLLGPVGVRADGSEKVVALAVGEARVRLVPDRDGWPWAEQLVLNEADLLDFAFFV